MNKLNYTKLSMVLARYFYHAFFFNEILCKHHSSCNNVTTLQILNLKIKHLTKTCWEDSLIC